MIPCKDYAQRRESAECKNVSECGSMCDRTGEVPEPLEAQVERLKKMTEWLADDLSYPDELRDCHCPPHVECDYAGCTHCRIQAAYDVVEKEKENG
jgi:hypothetical protein